MEWIKKSEVEKLFEKWIVTITEDFVPGRVISYQIDNRFLDELKELETKTIDEGCRKEINLNDKIESYYIRACHIGERIQNTTGHIIDINLCAKLCQEAEQALKGDL